MALLLVAGAGMFASGDARAAAPVYLRVNQLGYPPNAAKLAIGFSTEAMSGSFSVVDVKTSQTIFTGQTRLIPQGAWGKFSHLAEFDFTPVAQPGRYLLQVNSGQSLPFQIDAGVYHPLPDDLLDFIRQQRCGFNPWLQAACHSLDGRTAYGPLTNGSPLDVRGGWHDAADLLKYLLTSGNATAQLLLAWELAQSEQRNSALLFADRVDDRGLSGTNGIPDLLDEARWGLEWLLKLHPSKDQFYHQVADDRDHCGWRLPQNEKAEYGWGPGGARVVYFADGKPQGLGGYTNQSTGVANLAGRYAAAMGLAFQIWKDDARHSAFARRCLQASLEVYQLGQAQPGVQQGNCYRAPYHYSETTWADDMEWGATELFRATGREVFREDAKRYARLAGAESWMGREQFEHYQFYPFINVAHYRLHGVVDADFQAVLSGWYREGIERCSTTAQRNPFGVGVPFVWCSNNLLVGLVTQCWLYERMSGDARYRQFGTRHRDWLLGRNPWGVTMFTEVGTICPKNVHLMTTRLTGRTIRGAMVDGPVYEQIFKTLKGVSITEPDPLAAFQDPRAVYHDDGQDYSTNEPTLDGTASAILMWTIICSPPELRK